jgi:surfeit locus 1 family protein
MNGRRIAAGVLTLGGIGVLCTLGTWQVQRLEWKNEIIARLDAARTTPQTFSYRDLQTLDKETLPLAYGTVRGTLLSNKEVLVGPKTNEDGDIGYQLVTPLKISGGTVLIDRGWVGEDSRYPKQRAHLKATGTVSFTGIARRPDYNSFTSGNNPAGDMWFKTDVQQIATAKDLGDTAPLVIYAERADRKFDAHRMNPIGWAPRNNHRQYAIFWFGMAGVLAAFYVFFQIRTNKKAA